MSLVVGFGEDHLRSCILHFLKPSFFATAGILGMLRHVAKAHKLKHTAHLAHWTAWIFWIRLRVAGVWRNLNLKPQTLSPKALSPTEVDPKGERTLGVLTKMAAVSSTRFSGSTPFAPLFFLDSLVIKPTLNPINPHRNLKQGTLIAKGPLGKPTYRCRVSGFPVFRPAGARGPEPFAELRV